MSILSVTVASTRSFCYWAVEHNSEMAACTDVVNEKVMSSIPSEDLKDFRFQNDMCLKINCLNPHYCGWNISVGKSRCRKTRFLVLQRSLTLYSLESAFNKPFFSPQCMIVLLDGLLFYPLSNGLNSYFWLKEIFLPLYITLYRPGAIFHSDLFKKPGDGFIQIKIETRANTFSAAFCGAWPTETDIANIFILIRHNSCDDID